MTRLRILTHDSAFFDDPDDVPMKEYWAMPLDQMHKGHKIVMQCTEANEPFFVLRGKDILSIFALKRYEADIAAYLGDDPVMGEQLAEIIADFQAWQRAHPQEIRLPD